MVEGKNIFGDNLKQAILLAESSQAKLAKGLKRSEASVTQLIKGRRLPKTDELELICDFLSVSADKLLGITKTTDLEQTYEGLRWIERPIPDYISPGQQEQIRQGIQFFKDVMIERKTNHELNRHHGGVGRLLKCFTVAVRSHILEITHVERDADKEEKIKSEYPKLWSVIIAKLPQEKDGKRIDDRSSQLIKTEMLSFLGAKDVFTRLGVGGAVGLGPGYSVLRLAEKTIPDAEHFAATKWVPLVVAENKDRGFTIHSANDIAAVLSIQHPGSRHVYRMFGDAERVARYIEEVSAIFLGVIGFNNTNSDNPSQSAAIDFHVYGIQPPNY